MEDKNKAAKVVIVGGVAGGASCAVRLRRIAGDFRGFDPFLRRQGTWAGARGREDDGSLFPESEPCNKWFVLDALPVTQVDVTGSCASEEMAQTQRARGVELMLARRMTESIELRKVLEIGESKVVARYFPTLAQAMQDYRAIQAAERADAFSI